MLRKVPFLKVLFLLHLLDYLNVAGSRHHPPAEEEEEEEAWGGDDAVAWTEGEFLAKNPKLN